MRVTIGKVCFVSVLLLFFLLISMFWGLKVGTINVEFFHILEWLRNKEIPYNIKVVLSDLRLPRVLIASLIGAGLSISGAVFQAVLRNPLAEPFILGVSGGAAIGAVSALLLGVANSFSLAFIAFCTSFCTIVLVFSVTYRRGQLESSTLILVGVMINSLFTAIIMFMISVTTERKLHAILFWLYGDLSSSQIEQVWLLLPVVLLGGIVSFFFARHLNLLSAGNMVAAGLGMAVQRVKLILLLIVSLIVGVTVSLSGIIGFVGLVIPHLIRMYVGYDYRLILPASALLGASFLVLSDTIARTIMDPIILPVGVVTAILGAPFFIVLLAKKGSNWW